MHRIQGANFSWFIVRKFVVKLQRMWEGCAVNFVAFLLFKRCLLYLDMPRLLQWWGQTSDGTCSLCEWITWIEISLCATGCLQHQQWYG